ncbi:AGAP002402-PA-like protein [Anopheles sinensis]|uniref:Copper homeostasis protein cutC homolog n=1 Tax=Anopheles sinensis TaxID=74873 RepID=A0A084VSC9_ANOSI|nr:AGAP002402-PA-like protein [Anopheles sinensis]
MQILLEICVDTYESAVAAIEGGANRLELCSALSEGGLTPTVGLLRAVKQFLAEWSKNSGRTVPVYCMVRCRRGSDFLYSQPEMDIMLWDLRMLKENGADGFVFGALDETGNVHQSQCEQVLNNTDTLPLTFHRAIDCTDQSKLLSNIKLIAELGFTTILTSGLKPSAAVGLDTIVQMRAYAEEVEKLTGKKIHIMPGSGVKAENIRTILTATGCRAIHGSASVSKASTVAKETISMGGSNVDALPLKICSKETVEELRKIIDSL